MGGEPYDTQLEERQRQLVQHPGKGIVPGVDYEILGAGPGIPETMRREAVALGEALLEVAIDKHRYVPKYPQYHQAVMRPGGEIGR